MSEIESWKLVLFLVTISFLIGVFYMRKASKGRKVSKTITFMLLAYSILSISIIAILYSILYYSAFTNSKFNFFILSNHPYIELKVFEIGKLCVDLLTFLSVIITLSIFGLSLIFSQLSLHFVALKLKRGGDPLLTEKIKSQHPWLKDLNVVVVNLSSPNAFSFSLLKIGFIKIRVEDWIVVTTGIINLLTQDELEVVLAHEYSHIVNHDTRYSHLIFTLKSLLFFDPIYKLVTWYMSSQPEFKADIDAVKLVKKPRALANALFKLTLHSQLLTQKNKHTCFLGHSKPIIVERIKRLLAYAKAHNLTE